MTLCLPALIGSRYHRVCLVLLQVIRVATRALYFAPPLANLSQQTSLLAFRTAITASLRTMSARPMLSRDQTSTSPCALK